jgi:hypothetical protein
VKVLQEASFITIYVNYDLKWLFSFILYLGSMLVLCQIHDLVIFWTFVSMTGRANYYDLVPVLAKASTLLYLDINEHPQLFYLLIVLVICLSKQHSGKSQPNGYNRVIGVSEQI